MRKSIVKAKLAQGKPVMVVKQNYPVPWETEMLGKMGFDCVWFCLEHLPYHLETAANIATAARAGNIDLLVRAARGEYMRIGRMLELGATGIMLARIDTYEEAKDFVTWTKFPPLGRRGIDAVNPDNDLGLGDFRKYLKWANAETFTIVQFESRSAVDCCEKVAELEGVDILFIGPGDLKLNMGIDSPKVNDDLEVAINRVAKAAAKNGKAWGLPAIGTDMVKKRLDQGARFLHTCADCICLMQGLQKIREDMSKLGFEFNPQV